MTMSSDNAGIPEPWASIFAVIGFLVVILVVLILLFGGILMIIVWWRSPKRERIMRWRGRRVRRLEEKLQRARTLRNTGEWR